ncbi:hypothetical protein CEXT_370131 [Caerostris extrusa]|uniref:Uncharacterized protein n=1 Tax=Caerostris extrusa TaxID=172846 RepID=A0AAV4NGI9_CAEEX|nr:hypothetical protein CEXT_370131 [Caerostris extrusa]
MKQILRTEDLQISGSHRMAVTSTEFIHGRVTMVPGGFRATLVPLLSPQWGKRGTVRGSPARPGNSLSEWAWPLIIGSSSPHLALFLRNWRRDISSEKSPCLSSCEARVTNFPFYLSANVPQVLEIPRVGGRSKLFLQTEAVYFQSIEEHPETGDGNRTRLFRNQSESSAGVLRDLGLEWADINRIPRCDEMFHFARIREE